jgi:hypothetical protein
MGNQLVQRRIKRKLGFQMRKENIHQLMQRRIKCKLGFQMGVGWGVGFEIQAYV